MTIPSQPREMRISPAKPSFESRMLFTLFLLAALIGFGVGVASGVSHGLSPVNLLLDALLLTGALSVGILVAFLAGKVEAMREMFERPPAESTAEAAPAPTQDEQSPDATDDASKDAGDAACANTNPPHKAAPGAPCVQANGAPVNRELQEATREAMRRSIDPAPSGNRIEVLKMSDNFHRMVQAELSAFGLTRQERSIAELVIRGNNYPDIAKRLYLSVSSVKYHAHAIYTKAHVSSKREFQELMRRRIISRS